jgi:hypothetical protein
MIGDPDIFRAAMLVIGQQGTNAADFALQRAAKLIEDGDVEGAMVWRGILEAIVLLQRERREGEVVN